MQAANFPTGKETVQNGYARITSNSAVRPRIVGSLATDQAIIGRQPVSFPVAPQTPGAFPSMGQAGQPNAWQHPFAGVGSLNSMSVGGGPGAWPVSAPEWPLSQIPQSPAQISPASGFPQSSQFWPQPSQWPYVDTAGQPPLPPSAPQLPPPAGGNAMFGWGQQPPPLSPPSPGSIPQQPWQIPYQSQYSQWLPTSLGSASSPLSPPWSAPGTIVGGPQIGHWPAAHSPPLSRPFHHPPYSLPEYIRTGHDASVAAVSTRNANSLIRSHNNHLPTSRYVIPEKQPSVPESHSENNRDIPYSLNFHPVPPAPPAVNPSRFNVPASDLAPFLYQILSGKNSDRPYIIVSDYATDGVSESVPTTNTRRDIIDINLSMNDHGLMTPHSKIVDEIAASTPYPTTQTTDDPYALNPNIVFGGPASITFPELTVDVPPIKLPNHLNLSAINVNSVRVGDILSFPHGTQFGVVPPPFALPKKGPAFSSRSQSNTLTKSTVINSSNHPTSENIHEHHFSGSVMPTLEGSTNITQISLSGQNSSGTVVREGQGRRISKNWQNVKQNESSLMDVILAQIRELKIVLYGKSNCSACIQTEAMLKSYSVPVYFFELDNLVAGEQMLGILEHITHSSETPLTFICGRFVGGYQRLYDLHVNQQINALLRECMPSKKRSPVSTLMKRPKNKA